MKTIVAIFLACGLLFPFSGVGQEISEGMIKVGKEEQSGYIARSKYNKSLVEEAIMQKFDAAGLKKAKKHSKFNTYKEVTLPDISANKIDLYYKISEKKSKAKIYFLVSKGYNNYVTSVNDAAISAGINAFLGKIDAAVQHNEEIREKEEEVRKMNEKLAQEKMDVKKAEDAKNKKDQELNELKQEKSK